MPDHETLSCPRCHAEFECKMGTILNCQCSGIALTREQQQSIAERWSSCLCRSCLEFLSRHKNLDEALDNHSEEPSSQPLFGAKVAP